MAVRQSSMFKFIQRSERPTSHHTDVTEEFTARCDSGLPPAKAVTLTDIANYASFDARCRLTSDQRFQMLTNRYTPPPNFQFPGTADKRGSQRRFQPSWLQRYSWLQYSVQADGGFCVPCMLFGVGRDGVDLGVLVSKPLTNFKKALEELKAHDIRNTRRGSRGGGFGGRDPPLLSTTNFFFFNKLFNYSKNKKKNRSEYSMDAMYLNLMFINPSGPPPLITVNNLGPKPIA